MGKWAQPDYDQELVRKFRLIFDELKTKLGNDQNGEPYTFDKFVENLDETDHFTKRICEFLVKEARPRRGHVARAPFDRFRRMRVVNDAQAEAERRNNGPGLIETSDDDDQMLFDPIRNMMGPPLAPLELQRREELIRLRLAADGDPRDGDENRYGPRPQAYRWGPPLDVAPGDVPEHQVFPHTLLRRREDGRLGPLNAAAAQDVDGPRR